MFGTSGKKLHLYEQIIWQLLSQYLALSYIE